MAGSINEMHKWSVTKFNGKNYFQWQYRIKTILEKEGLWKIISETTIDSTTEQWQKKDAGARAIIVMALDDSILNCVMKCNTSQEMWNSLKKLFEHQGLSSAVYIRKKLNKMKKKPETHMVQYLNEVEEMINQLKATGENFSEQKIIGTIFRTLDDEYDNLIKALEARDINDLSLELVKMKIIDEATRKENKEGEEKNRSVLQVKYTEKQENKLRCYSCGKWGHSHSQCTQGYRGGSQRNKYRNEQGNFKEEYEYKNRSYMTEEQGNKKKNKNSICSVQHTCDRRRRRKINLDFGYWGRYTCV